MEDDAELELEEQLEELLEEQLEEHPDEDGNVKTIMRIAKIQQKQEDGANSIKIMEDEIMDEIMEIIEDKAEPNEDIFKVHNKPEGVAAKEKEARTRTSSRSWRTR